MRLGDRKGWLWGLILTGLVVVAVPSVVLLRAVDDYVRFLRGTRAPLKPSRPSFTAPAESHRREPEVHLVRFEAPWPAAKEVRLVGDFNGWDAIDLDRRPDGSWQTLLPLPPGRYHYLFQIDGRWTLDPGSPATARLGAQQVSVRVVP